jgi:hypothetical protein
MTLVCCWLNESYGRTRITAIADSRASSAQPDGSYKQLSNATSKLFRLRARCHHVASLDTLTGGWHAPYYETEIAIGFSGYIFEALSILTLVTQAFDQLVTPGQGEPRPEDELLAEMVRVICERFFGPETSSLNRPVDFLMFGYSATTGSPWLWKISNTLTGGSQKTRLRLGPLDLHYIGSVDLTFQSKVAELRNRISKHRDRLRPETGPDSVFEFELETARHQNADKKIIEDKALSWFGKEMTSVGGVPQKVEAFEVGGRTVVTFSRGIEDYILSGLPIVGPEQLHHVPVLEKLGR